jgi:hypothetical protein
MQTWDNNAIYVYLTIGRKVERDGGDGMGRGVGRKRGSAVITGMAFNI